MSRIPITRGGYEKLKAELDKLRNVDRNEVILAIQEARGHGDLSENAEYDAAKERQGMIEARINELEYKMSLFEIIDISQMSGDKIAFGATVTIENIDTEERKTYTIVGSDEADIFNGKISIMSPLARAMMGKEEGDDFTVQAPKGETEYEIIKIKFIDA
ncbi:MAG: transcription elongation factor GreA [Mucispirillum sp.]|nr:transcription elongation factor GreA [Mucispirillum sp.]